MVVTEQQAKQLDCVNADKKCTATECMAWRWHYVHEFAGRGAAGLEPVPKKTDEGYCGLCG